MLVSIEPCRLVDTRADSQVGPRNMPIGTAEEYDVTAHGANGNCTIPATASGLSLNVTTLNATAPTNVRIFAADAALPTTSNLNPVPGRGAVAELGDDRPRRGRRVHRVQRVRRPST